MALNSKVIEENVIVSPSSLLYILTPHVHIYSTSNEGQTVNISKGAGTVIGILGGGAAGVGIGTVGGPPGMIIGGIVGAVAAGVGGFFAGAVIGYKIANR